MYLIALVAFLASFASSLALTFLVRRAASRVGLVDHPAARKVHVRPTPLGGGVAVWFSVSLTLAAIFATAWYLNTTGRPSPISPDWVKTYLPGVLSRAEMVAVILGAATLIMLLGLADDVWGLHWGPRLAVQAALVLALIAWKDVRLTLFIQNPWITAALTVVWIVGLTNAFNFLDNMDGLSAGVAWISAALFAAVMALAGDYFVAGFLVVLLGALSGFLCFNFPPATIFMGDAGSNFIGFTLGVATVLGTYFKPDRPESSQFGILAPLCVLAVPLYDMLSVIVIRVSAGQSPFHPDKNHFSHRLVALGMRPKHAVLTIYFVTLATGLGALLLYEVPLAGAVVILLQVLCLLGIVAVLEAAARRGNHRNAVSPHPPREDRNPEQADSGRRPRREPGRAESEAPADTTLS